MEVGRYPRRMRLLRHLGHLWEIIYLWASVKIPYDRSHSAFQHTEFFYLRDQSVGSLLTLLSM